MTSSCSCGGGGASGFCESYATAFCDYEIRCGQVSSTGKADCVTYIRDAFCAGAVPSATKGYQTFDAMKGQACVDSLTAASCDSLTSLNCDGLYTATSDTGGGCFVPSDCKNAADSCGGSGCMKTCQVAGELGKPCTKAGTCTAGRCDASNVCAPPGAIGADCRPFSSNECDATGACDSATSKCVALPSVGQACRSLSPRCSGATFCNGTTCQTRLSQGAMCSGGDSCEAGLTCDFSQNPDSCQPRKAAGSACIFLGDCQVGLRCISAVCTAPKTAGQPCVLFDDCADGLLCDPVLRACTPSTSSLKAGDSCTDRARYCGPNLTCKGAAINRDAGVGTVGTCGERKLGDACETRSSTECPEHSFCNLAVDGGAGTCITASVGSPCTTGAQCLTGDFCKSGLCSARVAMGQPCTASSNCVAPLACVSSACGKLGDEGTACSGSTIGSTCLFPFTCVGGTCKHAGAKGEPCLNGLLCISGACVPDAGTCGAKQAEGGACSFFGNACESGRCTNGKCEVSCQ